MKDTSVFKILGFKEKTPESTEFDRANSGTGFFVREDGLFISAGHVFKDKSLCYYAMINDRLYSIQTILVEYLSQENQKGNHYKDLFIGKIDNYEDGDEIQALTLSEHDDLKEELSPVGYSPYEIKTLKQTEVFTLDDLDDIDDEPSIFNQLFWYDKYQLNYEFVNLGFDITKDSTGVKFENGFTIQMQGQDTSGISGGPVFEKGDQSVKGMLITVNCCISSKYVISKLNELI